MRGLVRLYTQLHGCSQSSKPLKKSLNFRDSLYHSRQKLLLSATSCLHTSTQSSVQRNPLVWMNMNSSLMDVRSDLNRFLIEVGTDPKEARYWLRYFSSSVDEYKVFAVVCVDEEVLLNQCKFEAFASTVAFLHRNKMCPLIIHGCDPQDMSFKATKDRCVWNAIRLSDMLEKHGTLTHILYPGCGVLDVNCPDEGGLFDSYGIKAKPELIMQNLSTNHVPILLSFGETADGRMVFLKPWDVTVYMAKTLQPLKVLFVNSEGGFLDGDGRIITNINLPSDLTVAAGKQWCTPDIMDTMTKVNTLIGELPLESSVVITSADKILQELFSHRGSGTFFRQTEAIHTYHSLDGIDLNRLRTLLVRSFKKELSETYFDEIAPHIQAIYLSETFSGVAIIMKGNQVNTPYMCKFAVTTKAQGQGVGEILWDTLRQNEPSLFWRSSTFNPINMWYFKKCEGCWNDDIWSVFWYGVADPSLSSAIIQDATQRSVSFPVECASVESLK